MPSGICELFLFLNKGSPNERRPLAGKRLRWSVFSEGGATLSGGEKQRISIARAILKDAPIIILDEATANVDPENEDKLTAAFSALTQDKTVIMVAHRLKTIRDADKIVVFEGGKITEGRHDDLLESNAKYRNFIKLREEAAAWRLQS